MEVESIIQAAEEITETMIDVMTEIQEEKKDTGRINRNRADQDFQMLRLQSLKFRWPIQRTEIKNTHKTLFKV
jgi:hypothetical protein